MNSELLMTVIMVIGIGIGLFSEFLLKSMMFHVEKIRNVIANNREFKKLQENVKKMKEDGDYHEWITIPLGTKNYYVCQKTGFCAELNGFIPMHYVESYKNNLAVEAEYKTFRTGKVIDMAHRLSVPMTEMEKIVNEIFTMKKDFTLQRMERLQKEMEQKASEVANGKI